MLQHTLRGPARPAHREGLPGAHEQSEPRHDQLAYLRRLARVAAECDVAGCMRVLTTVFLLACVLTQRTRARAEEPAIWPAQPSKASSWASVEPEEPVHNPGYFPAEPGWLWRRSHGAAVLTLGGELAFVPSSKLLGGHKLTGGVEGQVLGAPRRSPFLLGLGLGSVFFERARHTERGPWKKHCDRDHPLDCEYGPDNKTTRHSLQLRHVEVAARFQPRWGPVRPYVEASFGVGILWSGIKLDRELHRKSRSAAILYAASVGIDWQLYPFSGRNKHLVIVSMSVRRLYTGPLTLTKLVASDSETTKRSHHGSLALWTPVLAVGLAF